MNASATTSIISKRADCRLVDGDPGWLYQCGKPTATANGTFKGSYPIKATVTVGMVADLVREIVVITSRTQLMGRPLIRTCTSPREMMCKRSV